MSLEQALRTEFREAAEGLVAELRAEMPAWVRHLIQSGNELERLTYAEAAAELRISEGAVRNRVRDGLLPAFTDSTKKFILRKDINAYNARLAEQQAKELRDARIASSTRFDAEIDRLLNPARPGRTAKKKARR